MAFGFIIERFELFSIYVRASLDGRDAQALVLGLNPLALILLVAGMSLIVFATVRFYAHQRMIESDEESSYRTGLVAVSLAALLILVAAALILLAI
jgi:putative membrane protein